MTGVALAAQSPVVDALNGLSDVFETRTARTAVTLAALAVLTGIGWVTTQVQSRLREHLSDFRADVLTLLVVGSTFLGAIAVILGVWQVTDDLARALRNLQVVNGPALAVAFVVVVVTYLLTRVGRRLVESLVSRRDAFGRHEVEITYRILQITLWVAAVSVILGLFQVDLTGVLVGAGFLGIVVGMAARQTLGAVLAGFVLMFARPFEIGDWVEIGDNEGIVTDISIVNTRVQSFDGEYIMIPNDIVSGQDVINRSRKGRLRIEVEVGVDYDADVGTAAELAGEAMDDLDAILSVPTPQVIVKRFGDSAVVLGCRFWIDKPSARRKWRARTAVVSAVKERFEEAGVKIPFPQRELSGREEAGGFRHADVAESVAETNDDDVDADPDPDTVVEPADEDLPMPGGASDTTGGLVGVIGRDIEDSSRSTSSNATVRGTAAGDASDQSSTDGDGSDQPSTDGDGSDQPSTDGDGSDQPSTDGDGSDQPSTDGDGEDAEEGES